ncbi:TonB-dependent receptor [Sphingobium sp. Leaf26]|uniref:TonB-dependent receptor n=1 Tax=Sphingobium sp. Leaf26 TaxID=1735693 RepID=UPI0006F9598C|nr:TonB-dependent receptor [Sphingobium sp. Leaf26]KQN05144.1 TonB-dependent receptor [Sphingobium sp. Leaf26]
MRFVHHMLAGAAACAVIGFVPSIAYAQNAADADPADIVVTGIRASLQSAQNIKRNSDKIVDSIVAEDIGKLPDINVAEALQRVSGIQVSRDRGEGGGVAIRGLSQVLTTMNGREIFTAGGGRSFNLQDVPSELLSGIDVYKTPSADLIEGGIGGVIDLRTRKPLDKKGFVFSASARARYSDLADEVKPMASVLVSNSWDTDAGEFGILVSAAYQERAFATDIINVGAPNGRNDIIAGQTVNAPNGSYQPAIKGNRRRIGVDGIVQWKPTPELEIYGQVSYQDFRSIQTQFGLNIPTNGRTAVPGSATLFDGTNDIRSISYNNVAFSTFGVARDTYDENFQYSGGVTYETDKSRFNIDASYSTSKNTLYYSELDLAGVAPLAQQNVSGSVPSMALSGIDLNNIASYTIGAMTRNENYFKGDMWAIKGDASFDIESPILKSLNFGLRWAKRGMDFTPVRFFQTPGTAAARLNAGPYADLFMANPLNNMFNGSGNINQDFLVADPDALRSIDSFNAIRQQLGITAQVGVSQPGIYSINETTLAGYAMAKYGFDLGSVPVDGNIGVRVIRTGLNVTGNRLDAGQTVPTPIDMDSNYMSVLPSANIRFKLSDELQLRLSASQVLTRPGFGQLAPTLTLIPAQNTGSSGNPDLRPLKADQLDASLEYYFSPTGSLYLAGFYRNVQNFILTGTVLRNIDGIEYSISAPTNSNQGKIKGVEVGGQTFFDFMPGLLSGFGVQANYTFVDSSTGTSIAGLSTPLTDLSKHSFNVSAIYEKGPLSARLAYNWRDKFLTGLFTNNVVTGLPVYRKAYGWLDASINLDVTKNVTLSLEGSNLTRSKTHTYYGRETLVGNLEQDDIQVLGGVRVTF